MFDPYSPENCALNDHYSHTDLLLIEFQAEVIEFSGFMLSILIAKSSSLSLFIKLAMVKLGGRGDKRVYSA